MKNARLLCCWQLRTILNRYRQIVQRRMKHSLDLMNLYAPPPPPQFYSSLMEDKGTSGWDRLIYWMLVSGPSS
ncbi:unnamed protein product [Nyctereutes procyonoides]|uniref:(raccoon dog) hypothetical protein n=1 Tax=Nyctereutes procyonoides TaxID=34880 RepID=A0A811Y7U6_NYCPR|nr:unnamed protein product [Nyctereutes procyonoides]